MSALIPISNYEDIIRNNLPTRRHYFSFAQHLVVNANCLTMSEGSGRIV
jgi:hypothetical protein